MSQELEPKSAALESFETSQRIASAFSRSDFIPAQFKGNVANCLIVLEMANRINCPPLMVAQNLSIIHGKPSFSSSFLIACFNMTGKFTTIKYNFSGEVGTDSYGCYASAIERETGEVHTGVFVSLGMAKAEGWSTKSGSKWKNMCELMIRYRAATFFIRQTVPEISMGLHTQEEIIDIQAIDVTPAREKTVVTPTREKTKSRSVDSLIGSAAETVIEVEAKQPEPVAEPEDPHWETMPIPELEPEPIAEPKQYVNLHDQWRAKIVEWQTVSDVAKGLTEMPPQIKSDLKDFIAARNEFVKANVAA